MRTYRTRQVQVAMIQFSDARDLSAVAEFCGEGSFQVTSASGGRLVPQCRSSRRDPWMPVPYGAWLLRVDGALTVVPAALSAVLAALLEEVQ